MNCDGIPEKDRPCCCVLGLFISILAIMAVVIPLVTDPVTAGIVLGLISSLIVIPIGIYLILFCACRFSDDTALTSACLASLVIFIVPTIVLGILVNTFVFYPLYPSCNIGGQTCFKDNNETISCLSGFHFSLKDAKFLFANITLTLDDSTVVHQLYTNTGGIVDPVQCYESSDGEYTIAVPPCIVKSSVMNYQTSCDSGLPDNLTLVWGFMVAGTIISGKMVICIFYLLYSVNRGQKQQITTI